MEVLATEVLRDLHHGHRSAKTADFAGTKRELMEHIRENDTSGFSKLISAVPKGLLERTTGQTGSPRLRPCAPIAARPEYSHLEAVCCSPIA